MASRVLGVDSGGTFTDLVLWEDGKVRTHKRPSTPEDPSLAILAGIKEAGLTPDQLVHGSTVATNTILTGSGARTAFVTTKGFRDVLTIGRQARAREDLYSLTPAPVQTLVPRELCFEADERVSAQGEIIQELTEEEARRVMAEVASSGAECVAVCLLFSFLAPAHERQLKRIGEEIGLHVSASHEVLPEAREYERGSTTVISSYVAPAMTRYLERLDQATSGVPLRVMLSDATTTGVQTACENAVRTVLSGPAAGVTAAFSLASAHGHERALTFDMGGTSTDVAFCAGDVALRRDVLVGGLPIATPTVDVHSVGAGGGSVAYVDEAGALRVGPESAGADPGPAAYGRGGPPTVTDAQIVLRRITGGSFLGGRMQIDPG
ncbi:MAG TPA: hydantoinase/oxoprolinase family protein, partial [Dehalococcoidia bacterium]